MATGKLRPALRAWKSFGGAPPVVRAFLAARLGLMVPLRDLDRELRGLSGRVLSLGSGYGVLERYLAEINSAVRVEGFEIDAARVELAARTAPPRVEIREQDVRALDEHHAWDAAIAVDVLHHVPDGDHHELAAALARALKPGGVLLVKDIARTPSWRHGVNRLHDRLATGDGTVFTREPEEMAAVFAAQGFTPELCKRIGRASPYPHYLLRLRAGAA